MEMAEARQETNGEMTVASFLKSCRLEAGLSQKELAEQAGVGLSSIKQYERENNGAVPPVDKAAKLAYALGFDPRDLFSVAIGVDFRKGDEQHPEGHERQELIARADEAMSKIEEARQRRGLLAPNLSLLVRNAHALLDQLGLDELMELKTDFVSLEASGLPDGIEDGEEGVSPELLGEACKLYTERYLISIIFEAPFGAFSEEQLDRIHAIVAEGLGASFPLPGVPKRGLWDRFASDKMETCRHCLQLRIALYPFILELVETGKAGMFCDIYQELGFDRDAYLEKRREEWQRPQSEQSEDNDDFLT